MYKKKFFQIIQKNIGLSLSNIHKLNPSDINSYIEKQNNKKVKITSEFPFIGRGNVLRDKIVTNNKINQEIDKILGKL